MLYGHIFRHEEAIYITYRYRVYFFNESDEKLIAPKIMASFAEESGDMRLLNTKVAKWADEHGIENIIGMPDGKMDDDIILDEKTYIEKLRKEIHFLAHELYDISKSRDIWIKIAQSTALELEESYAVIDDALSKNCKHVRSAIEGNGENCTIH